MTIRLLAIAASTRTHSLNRRLLQLAVQEAQRAGAEVTVLEYAELSSPMYEGENVAMPAGAEKLSHALRAHDGLLLASPEYNWSVPGGLKNLIDWLSTDPSFPLKDRTALLMCASPSMRGGISGLQHLRVPLELLGMWVYPQMIGIGDAIQNLGATELTRLKDQQHLVSCVSDFVRATSALRSPTHA